jgi:hypothetical protein
MSERWKYQLKTGMFWGVFMAVSMTMIDACEHKNFGLILSWNFLLKFIVFCAVGIFILGYFNWKAKEKERPKP